MAAETGSRGPGVRLEGSKQLTDDFWPQEQVSVRPWDGEPQLLGRTEKTLEWSEESEHGRCGWRCGLAWDQVRLSRSFMGVWALFKADNASTLTGSRGNCKYSYDGHLSHFRYT